MNPDMLWFARPWWLLALLPLGLLCWQRWRKPRDGAAWPAIDAHLLPHLLCGGPRRGGALACGAALLLAVLALAGPMSGARQPALRPDVMRVIVVDLSPAMLPHLDRLKSKLLTLLRHLPEGENALLLYAGEPYLVVPPTVDANAIAHFIPELAVDAMPLPGNRPELALRMANQTLQRGAAAGRHIVWITARADVTRLQVSELDKVRVSVLQIAQEADPALDAVTRHTGGTFLLARSDDGDARQLAGALAAGDGWSADARLVRSGRDLGPWLLLLALPPAAFAFRRNALLAVLPLVMVAPPPAEAVARIFHQTGPQLEQKADVEPVCGMRSSDPLCTAGLRGCWRAICGHFASPLRVNRQAIDLARERKLPRNSRAITPRSGEISGLALPAPLADYHALRLLQAGEAEAAAARFADPRWRAAASYRAGRYEQAARLLEGQRDPDSLYNRGNALARQGLLAEALASYEASLRLRPGDADTLHNRDLVRQLLQRPEGGGATPPPPSAAGAPAEREAARVAEQWLRSVPDDPGSLLRSKLQSEHRRRLAGGEAHAW